MTSQRREAKNAPSGRIFENIYRLFYFSNKKIKMHKFKNKPYSEPDGRVIPSDDPFYVIGSVAVIPWANVKFLHDRSCQIFRRKNEDGINPSP